VNRPRRTDRHLPPCVYFKHGRYWYVKKGKWHDLGTHMPTALAEYAQRISIRQGSMPDLIETAYKHHSPKVAESTRAQYRIAAEVLKRKLAPFDPQQVKGKHIAKIKIDGAKTPNMTNRVLSFARIVFGYAVEAQLIESNPCIGIKRHEEAERERYLTDDEFFAIRDQAGPRLQVILDLLYCTGQRITDVLTIRRSDITDRGITFKQKKTGAKLVVLWTPEMKAAVERAKTLYGNVTALTLLHGRTGKAPNYRTVLKQWHEARIAAKVEDATPHDMRAKSGTDTKRQGNDAQALLGHSSPQMTERYIRLRDTPEVTGPSFRQPLDVGQKG
jgi:integrase